MKSTLVQFGVLAGMMLIGPAKSAFADIVFTTSGTTSGGAVSGKATFSLVGSNELDITLVNTSTVSNDADVLAGLAFTLTGGTGLSLTSVNAASFQDCTSGTCVVDPTFHGSTSASPTYGWQLSSSFTLYAGSGSFKPAGIIDPTKVSSPNPSVTGSNFNDHLAGPVTFKLSFTTAPTNVTAATFHWGTAAVGHDETTGTPTGSLTSPVPEPTSILLLATVAIFAIRKRAF